jgi:hypothetical protein
MDNRQFVSCEVVIGCVTPDLTRHSEAQDQSGPAQPPNVNLATRPRRALLHSECALVLAEGVRKSWNHSRAKDWMIEKRNIALAQHLAFGSEQDN